MMGGSEDDNDDVCATQPVLPLLLQGVVAYVEVRSGHDNLSRGVKTQLRNLGATVVEKLTKNVTHVVFNEGLPSTYKKAKKFKCHLVSVLWIGACKEELTVVSEAGYPPIGQQIYENPLSIKNFKKLKSMQPDFDEEEAERKREKILKRIKRRKIKPAQVSETECQNKSPMENTCIQSRSSIPSRTCPVKRSPKKIRKKRTQTKTALKEMVSNSGCKSVVLDAIEQSSVPVNNKERMDLVSEAMSEAMSSQSSNSSSSSVIYCGQVEEAVQSRKSSAKLPKRTENASLSRVAFVDGLNDIMLSLSQEKNSSQGKNDHSATQFMRPTQVSPRKSSLKKGDSLYPCVSSRRSPRHIMNANHSKKDAEQICESSGYTTASATLLRKRKVPLPSSPNDSIVLLSQEPGDMPSIDDLVKMRKGSIPNGDELITLSQVVRSYNAVAEGYGMKSSQSSSASTIEELTEPHEKLDKKCCNSDSWNEDAGSRGCLHQKEKIVEAEFQVDPHDTEIDQHLHSFCPSESGSTVSSVSGNVMINGKVQKKVNLKASSSAPLPDSEEIDTDKVSLNTFNHDISSLEEDSEAKYVEREPSPIFVIKKARVKRPMRKQQIGSAQHADLNLFKTEDVSAVGLSHCGAVLSTSLPSDQGKECLSPIDYINKLLPRFSRSHVNTTPSHKDDEVLVQETPDIPCASKCETSSLVIPPTPLENSTSPLNQSQNFSVISCLKKGGKVPLFSTRSSKYPQTVSLDSKPNTVAYGGSASTCDEYHQTSLGNSTPMFNTLKAISTQTNSSNDGKSGSDTSAHYEPGTLTRLKVPHRDSEIKQGALVRRSPRTTETVSPSGEAYKASKRKIKSGGTSERENPGVEGAKTDVVGRKSKRRKVVVTIVRTNGNNMEDSKKCRVSTRASAAISTTQDCLPKAEEKDCSSGYETSQSHDTLRNSVGDSKRKDTIKNAAKTAVKCRKASNILTPLKSEPKKRSEIYEVDDNVNSPSSNQEQKRSPRDNIRTRNTIVPKVETTKRGSGDYSDHSQRSSRFSRANFSNLSARSLSDLSAEGTKSSERKSSQEAKKRMARSATRSSATETPKVIVCTFLTASEQNGVEAAGETLGNWKLEEKVSSRTTHVINSGPKRTLNMLKGMVRGCWLVNQNWILDSSKTGAWLDEEKYELASFSPAVRLCRLRRQAMGKEFKHTLFAQSGPIFVSPKTEGPPVKDLRELLELSGADLLTSLQDAKIIVGHKPSQKGDFQCVKACWVLDCITQNKILSVNDPAYKLS